MSTHLLAITFLLPFLFPPFASGFSCNLTVSSTVTRVDGSIAPYNQIQPGGTICLSAGNRSPITFINLHGQEGSPINIINSGGIVAITNNGFAGIQIRHSDYLHLSGTGLSPNCGATLEAPSQQCGIVITGAGEIGLHAYEGSRYLEIDHLEVNSVSVIGLHSKSLPSEGYTRTSWTQYQTSLHDNYIHDVGTEGIYLGASEYMEDPTQPVLDGVQVYNNYVADTGWDGIQVGSAINNCAIHHNRIYRDSKAKKLYQESGVMVNPGSVCDVYANFLDGGNAEYGIYVQGNGGNKIFNNIITNRLQNNGSGIALDTGSNTVNSLFIFNNTIVNMAAYGINFYSHTGNNNQIKNNLIVSGGTSPLNPGIAQSDHNLILTNLTLAKFVDPAASNFALQTTSPAIDVGNNLTALGITNDFLGAARPQGSAFDIGAYEYIPNPNDLNVDGVVDWRDFLYLVTRFNQPGGYTIFDFNRLIMDL